MNGTTATSDVTVTIATVTVPNPVLTVSPNTELAVVTHLGDTIQFIAYGNLTGGAALQDLTSRVSWVSSNASVATISASGLATAKGVGNTTVTAGFNGKTVTTDLTVSTAAILAPQLTIVPSMGGTASHVGETTQFLAFGALGDGPTLQDLTSRVRWVSSDVAVATINAAGLATAVGVPNSSSTTIITAIATTPSLSVLTQTSSLTVTANSGTRMLATLALYEVAGGTGTVTSSPAGVTCGPQATCTGNFTLGTSVTLTAVPDVGSSFGGWSSNCTALPNSPPSPHPSCTVTMSDNTSVGAIFNRP